MIDLKKVLIGSAVVLLPGGFLVVAGYLLYKRFGSNKDAVQIKTSDADCRENKDESIT